MSAGATTGVLHVTDTPGFGGAERAMLLLIDELGRLGFEQRLLVHPHAPAGLLDAAAALGVPVATVPDLPEGLTGLRRLPGFTRRLRAERPGIFHAHLTYPLACKFPLAAARLAGVPGIVATEQLMLEFPLPPHVRIQQRFVAGGVDRFIAVSEHVTDELADLGWPREKFIVIPNTVDLRRFPAAPTPRAAGERVVLALARLDPQKGLDHLVRAAARMPDVTVRIAGGGPLRGELEELARAQGVDDRVTFLGERSDVPELLEACDVFVLPSLYEGLPLSILEAMAAGRPVVATDIPGTRQAVHDGRTGLLVPPGDDAALATAITRVLDDPALGVTLARGGRELVEERHASDAGARRVAAIYEELGTSPR